MKNKLAMPGPAVPDGHGLRQLQSGGTSNWYELPAVQPLSSLMGADGNGCETVAFPPATASTHA